MKKILIKVNFRKIWDSNGTVYRKGFTITQKVYEAFQGILASEAAMERDQTKKLFLSKPLSKEGNKFFMNLTQAELFVKKVCGADDVECNMKRAQYDVNAYLEVR